MVCFSGLFIQSKVVRYRPRVLLRIQEVVDWTLCAGNSMTSFKKNVLCLRHVLQSISECIGNDLRGLSFIKWLIKLLVDFEDLNSFFSGIVLA